MKNNIKNFIKKRNELLKTFDKMSDLEILDKLIELNPGNVPSNPEVAKIGLHKARLYVPDISDKLKEKSKKWLTDRGYSLEIK